MRKKSLALTLMMAFSWLLGGGDLMGQTTVTIGTGTSTGDYFIRTNYNYALCESIFTATELNNALKNAGYATPAVGCIFNKVAYKAKTEVTREIEIYITTTIKSNFSNSADVVTVSSLDKVFSGSVTFEADAWTTITLDNQYEWDGTSNLLILVNDISGETKSSTNFYYSSASNLTNYNYRNTNTFNPTGLPTGNRTGNRTNIQLTVSTTDKPRPTTISTSSMGTTTATLGWASTSEDIINYTYQYKLASNDWEHIAGEGTVNTLTTSLSSLSAGTIYDFRVKANYSGGSSNWIEKNFITASNVTDNNKFNYGFEDVTEFEFWTISLSTANSDLVNTNYHDGSNCFYFKNNQTSQVIISPLLHTSSNGVHVKLYWKGTGSYSTKLNIGYSTTDSNTGSFTYPQFVTTNQKTYQCSEFDLTYSDIKYIAIQFDRNNSSSGDVYIDDIELSECQVSCSVPVNLALSSSSSNSATFTWDAVDGEIDGYEVYVSEDSTTPTEETSGSFTATNSYTKNSLEENTHYYAWVRTKCEEDSYSSWSSAVDFTTDCGIKNLPYTYGFEDASDFDCWRMNNCYDGYTKITSSTTNTGSYKFTFNNSTSLNLQTIITPELNTTSNGVRVEFYIRNSSSTGTPKLKIAYSTSGYDLASFDWTNCTEATANSYYYNDYQYFGFDFPYDGIKYIAIQYDRNGSSNNIFLDDIKFSNIPTIDLPYEYGFETDSELNSWIKRDCYTNTNIKNGGHSGSYSFGFTRANFMETQYLITPKLNGTTYGALISFYYTANANCKFQIGYSTTNNFTSSFTFGDEITETTSSYKYYEYYCPANTKYICIKYVATSSSNSSLNIDDVKIVTFDKVSNGEYWDNLSDWTPAGLPSATDDIYINHSITINDDVTATANNITLGPNGSLTIEDGGQLILPKTSTGIQATVKKETYAATAKDTYYWFAISSAVANPTVSSATNVTTGKYDLYRYNEVKNAELPWENYKNTSYSSTFTTLEKGRGYLYRNAANLSIAMTGDINVEDFDYPVTKTGTGVLAGFNLIGNPYSHNIYKGAGTAIPNGTDFLRIGFYYMEPTTGKWTLGTDNSTAIKPNEAIFVQADANGSIEMTNTNASSAKANNDYIMFKVANSQYSDETYAWFGKGRGLNKINHRNAEVPMLYINQDCEDYAIATMSDDTKTFSLNLKAMTMGKYTLSYKTKGDFSYLHVIDRLTGEDIDMLIEDEYSFVASPSDNDARFIVKLAYQANNSASDDEIFAYQSGNEIFVSGEGELQVFDVTGRKVMNATINDFETISGLSRGVYIFRLEGKTQKIVVR